MPWVNEDMCTGCGVCVEECPVDAMSVVDDTAHIDDEECIRCGRCHDVCPEEAVRHDSEKIPEEVEANLEWTKGLLRHFRTSKEKRELVERMKRYFAKQRKVAQQTIERLELLNDEL